MVGGLALGDYAWAYENMLNQVLEGQLPRNDRLVYLLSRSVSYLDSHLDFFLHAEQVNDATLDEISRVDGFVENPESPITESATEPTLSEDTEKKAPDVPLISVATYTENTSHVEPLEPVDFFAPVPELAEPEDNENTSHVEPLESVDFSVPVPGLTEAEDNKNTDHVEPLEPVDFSAPAASDLAETEDNLFYESEDQRIVWEMFKEELPDQLLAIDQQMQSLVADPGNAETLKELERELHTLKGSSRMAQLTEMGNAAHEAEELLECVRQGEGRAIDEQELIKLQSNIDHIGILSEQYLVSGGLPTAAPASEEGPSLNESDEVGPESIEEEESTTSVDTIRPEIKQEQTYESYLEQVLSEQSGVLPDLSALASIDVLSDEYTTRESVPVAPTMALQNQEQIRISAIHLDKMVESSNAMNIMQNATRDRLGLIGEDVGEFGRTAARLKQLLRSLELETETQIHAGYRDSGEKNRQNTGFDPLEMDEYSEIQRLSRALAESLNDLVNIEGDLVTHLRTADKLMSDSVQAGRELHQDLLTTRLVEVSTIIPRLRRIMRQVASEFGRKVSFETDGEALKLDRYLLQRMTAPIEHLLRNAVFHGIETPEERIATGKSEEGGVLLEVESEDTDVVFRISDDGRGLDKDKIRAKAIEQGLLDEHEQLSDQDIYKLILRSGFSTVDEANQVAGRGVGMDVANSEIKALGGSLSIDSASGSGCEFTVRLPLTMAANPVLFVAIQKHQYALPLSGVQGLTRLAAEDVNKHLGQIDVPLMLDDQPYTLQYLGDALGHSGRMELHEGDMHVVIFMNIGGHHIAWLVDAINGRHEVVLQSLGALFKTCPFYSAATVTSAGDVIMVPDMLELAEQAMTQAPSEELVLTDDERIAPVVRHDHPHILIVDDSITVRKVTEKLLVNKNFVVETAKDGLEALEKLAVFEADLVLLDIEMPRMDGFEVLSAVRNKPQWQELPILMISSRTAEKHLSHAKELGASDFLGKPYQNQDLLEHIFKHLQDYQVAVSEKNQTTKELVL